MLLITLIVMFAAIPVALHAVLEIRDTLFKMLFAHFAFAVFVTAIAGVRGKTAWVAGDTGRNAAFAVIERESMCAIILRGRPGAGGMAGGTVRAKCAEVIGRVSMTGYTGR